MTQMLTFCYCDSKELLLDYSYKLPKIPIFNVNCHFLLVCDAAAVCINYSHFCQ